MPSPAWRSQQIEGCLRVEVRATLLPSQPSKHVDRIGLERLRLWDMVGHEQLETPEHGYMLRGSPTCMIWANRHAGPSDILAFGTALGFLVFWRESQTEVRASLKVAGSNG
jgi:hypothetical protein